MPPSISMTLAAARQAAAIGGYASNPVSRTAPAQDAPAPQPVTPAKPQGTGLLVDIRA